MEKTFSLDRVEGTVKQTKTIEIPPFSTIQVHGMTKVKGHEKKVNLLVEPMENRPNPSMVVVPGYTVLIPGSSKVNMNVRNLPSRKITVKGKSIVAQVTAANMILLMLAQENSWESEKWKDKKTESSNLYSEMKTKTKLTKIN